MIGSHFEIYAKLPSSRIRGVGGSVGARFVVAIGVMISPSGRNDMSQFVRLGIECGHGLVLDVLILDPCSRHIMENGMPICE